VDVVYTLETVSLDDMDGFEFQYFVAHLFEKLNIGKAEKIQLVRDEGRDIVLSTHDGSKIVIECKHHPKGTIGRPVVQKLHSAVITARAKKGIIVTTGHFSQAAIKYAKSLGSLIELVDSSILYDLANRARIRLLKRGESTSVYGILPPSQRLLEQEMVNHFVGEAISKPNTPYQLTNTSVLNIRFIPAYLLEYSLHDTFSTSVGVVHRITINRGKILLSGRNGRIYPPELTRIITSASMSENWIPPEKENISSDKFTLGYSHVKKAGLKQIQQYHTETVSYYGQNNVHYTKTCVPRVSRILIKNFTQIYFPLLNVSCKIITRNHHLSLHGTQHDILIEKSDEGKCEICSKDLGNKRLLCNSCGRISHSPSIFGHSYSCEICGKTICKICTYWTRKYVFFKKKLCESCAKKLEREGKKIKTMT